MGSQLSSAELEALVHALPQGAASKSFLNLSTSQHSKKHLQVGFEVCGLLPLQEDSCGTCIFQQLLPRNSIAPGP